MRAYRDSRVLALDEPGPSSVGLGEALGRCDLACVVTAHPRGDCREVVPGEPPALGLPGVTRGAEARNLVRPC